MTRLRSNAATHVGLVRAHNEDAVLSMPDDQIWAVADGMGGHAAGDVASQIVAEHVMSVAGHPDATIRMQALRQAILNAHTEIRAEAARRNVSTIGTTIVAFMVANGHFVCFWVGDSRLYRLNDDRIEMLTSDHSVVGHLVAAGKLSWDEAEHHPNSNQIERAVGIGDVLEIDKIRGTIAPGDRFLICSDGLTKYLGFDALKDVLAEEPIETAPARLVDLALAGGGADNVSVIVVDAC